MDGPTPTPRPASGEGPVFDRATALHHVGGDSEVLRQILDLFLDQGRSRVELATDAWREGDARKLEQAAHSLKGTAATLGMARLCDAAGSVERLGAEGRAGAAGPAVVEMREAMDEVMEVLRAEEAS